MMKLCILTNKSSNEFGAENLLGSVNPAKYHKQCALISSNSK